MSDKLKPCPFCGGEARLIGHYPYSITCCNCRATTVICNTPDDAIDAWNRRVEPTFTLDELDAIRRNVRGNCVLLVREFSKIEQSIIDKCNAALKGGSVE